MRSAVTVSLVEEARQGPFVFHGDLVDACRQAQRLGFDAIEIFAPGPDAVEHQRLDQLLRDHRLSLAAVGTGAGWLRHRWSLIDPDREGLSRAKDFIKRMIEFAGRHQASAIVGSMQGSARLYSMDRTEARARLADALQELGEYAQSCGAPLLFEPLNRYETDLCNTLEEGAQLLGKLQTDHVRLLADLFHMNIEEPDIFASLRAQASWLGHLHFVDSNRRPAGCGHIRFDVVGETLYDIGYRGYASAEAFPYPDSCSAAQRTIDAIRGMATRAKGDQPQASRQ